MKFGMIVAAGLAGLFGIGLLLSPARFYAPLGITFTPMSETVAQAHGATLIGVAAINWLARNFRSTELVAIAAGNLIVQLASLGVAIRIYLLGASSAIIPAFVIHIGLSMLFIWIFLSACRQRQSASSTDPKRARS